MNGFDAYKMFVAIRNHFTTNYDYQKYGGKTNVTLAGYQKRNDKFMFDKLARLPNAQQRIVASFIEGCQWINEIIGEQGYAALIKHQQYTEAMQYNFRQQLSSLPQPIGNLVGSDNGTPKLAQMYFQKQVALETLVIIDDLVKFSDIWKDKLSADPLIGQLLQTIAKYRPFISYDKKKIQQTFVDFYVNR